MTSAGRGRSTFSQPPCCVQDPSDGGHDLSAHTQDRSEIGARHAMGHAGHTQQGGRGGAMRKLTGKELAQVSGGKLTSYNPGGQPHGESQTTYTSGGNAPPGQNKDLPKGLQ
jgi:hypothetical protein